MNSFVYVIYNWFTLEVIEAFVSENECIDSYNEYYCIPGYEWKAINLEEFLEKE